MCSTLKRGISYLLTTDKTKSADNRYRRIAQLATMLEMNDYSDRRPAGCKEPWKVLRKYTGYKKLYGERLHASNYVCGCCQPSAS